MRTSTLLVFVFWLGLYLINAQNCPTNYVSQLDRAWIRVFYNKQNPLESPVGLVVNATYSECYECLDHYVTTVLAVAPNDTYFNIFTQYSGTFYIYGVIPDGYTKPYEMPYEFQMHGNYTINITDVYDTNGVWTGFQGQIITDVEGINIWVPVYIAIGVLIGLVLLYHLLRYMIYGKGRVWLKNVLSEKSRVADESQGTERLLINSNSENANQSRDQVSLGANTVRKNMKERLQSLDTFRGISLSIMLFVNSGAGGYVELDHTAWNGLHLADLVFPWFIWMMGVSMALSFESQRKRGATKTDMLLKVLMRTAKLAFLNIMFNGQRSIDKLRVPGVLMRFSTSYFIVSLIMIYVPKYTKSDNENEGTNKIKDIMTHIYEFIPILVMLGLWLGLTFGLEVPGCPTGYIGPGGLYGSYGKYPNCTGGAAGYIDYQIFGVNHIYQYPTPQPVYSTQAYDPEGALGSLTSAIMVWIGVMAGRVLIYHKEHKERITRWLIGAFILGCLSLIMCHGEKNGGWIPLNKNMWSLSFIVTLSCFALLILPALYVLIDIKKYWGGGPFKAMGMNSITIYCGSEFLAQFFPFSTQMALVNGCYNPSNDTHGWLLFRDIKNTLFWLGIANWMDYEKFYVNL